MALPHDRDSVAAPSHPAPHSLPAIQGRLLVCVPIPHCVEQAPHSPYAPHLLFTVEWKERVAFQMVTTQSS